MNFFREVNISAFIASFSELRFGHSLLVIIFVFIFFHFVRGIIHYAMYYSIIPLLKILLLLVRVYLHTPDVSDNDR